MKNSRALPENDTLNLQNRVALVTGGSRGIGRAVVQRLAEHGVHTVVNYIHDKSAAEETVKNAKAKGSEAIAIQANVALHDEAFHLVQQTVERFGRLDILVCNAGIWKGAAVDEISEEVWDEVIDINLKGTWTVCKAAVPRMKHQHFGRIVLVSSTAGQRGEANVSNYAASKGGQISFAKSLATELAENEITVNVVAPGWVDTDMNVEVFAQEHTRSRIEGSIPLERIATADDIAFPIVFLCSDWAKHITGEVLNVNGGSVLCG
jgi:3-oxoacyl-[acyl-carrier protein] reductase